MYPPTFPPPGLAPLYVAYQPVLKITNSELRIAAFECLLRVNENPHGQNHLSVIDAAEGDGTILALDYWVAQQACLDVANNPGMKAWINLSQATLSSATAVHRITHLITANEVADQLKIEMTETQDGCEATIIQNLSILKRMSIGVVIDDIQDGFSKAHLLKTDLVAGCKLSRNSTVRMAASTQHYDDTASMVAWCKDNQKTVVMEGIETERELEIALRLGVDFCQGFYFYPPLGIQDLPATGSVAVLPHWRERLPSAIQHETPKRRPRGFDQYRY